jgi:hypothetical protein
MRDLLLSIDSTNLYPGQRTKSGNPNVKFKRERKKKDLVNGLQHRA